MSIQEFGVFPSVGDLWSVFIEQLRVRSDHTPGQPGALAGDMTIEALPTWYAGTTFRSALEAGWAATLDSLRIRWEYEPQTIQLLSGVNYIPDFWLPQIGTWLEVKGTGVPRVEKAIELGEARACHCGSNCSCSWPGGELVLIGHPPKRYDPWSDPQMEGAHYKVMARAAYRHGGHPAWSTAHGRAALLTRCTDCHQAGWFELRAPIQCRACRGPLPGAPTYQTGAPELRFITADCQPALGEDNPAA